jgi:hypothetical protein
MLDAHRLRLLPVLRALCLRLLDALRADLLALGAGLDLRPFGAHLLPRSDAGLSRSSPLRPGLLALYSGLLTILASLLTIGALRLRRSVTASAAACRNELRMRRLAAPMTARSGSRRDRDRQCGDTRG